ncbi:hypothetical protein [Chelativorans alearense]|uniref:hypothetical protein n=1 Tax=Chelativorans alearense TaxID=2681495 RepID=UPI0013D40A2A|nr:hypothetical protein [Chelativorans alearense]
MSFRRLNRKYLVPGAQTVMILGIVALCQPWNLFLHRYGVTITLIGLVAFLITSHIPPEAEAPEEDAHEGRLAE